MGRPIFIKKIKNYIVNIVVPFFLCIFAPYYVYKSKSIRCLFYDDTC